MRFLETHHHASYVDRASRDVSDAVFTAIAPISSAWHSPQAHRAGKPEVLIALAFGAFVGLLKEADEGRFALDVKVLDFAEEAVWQMLAASPNAE